MVPDSEASAARKRRNQSFEIMRRAGGSKPFFGRMVGKTWGGMDSLRSNPPIPGLSFIVRNRDDSKVVRLDRINDRIGKGVQKATPEWWMDDPKEKRVFGHLFYSLLGHIPKSESESEFSFFVIPYCLKEFQSRFWIKNNRCHFNKRSASSNTACAGTPARFPSLYS